MPNLFDELRPPADRDVDPSPSPDTGRVWKRRASRPSAPSRWHASGPQRAGVDSGSDQRVAVAQDRLVGVQGETKMARKRLIERVARGDDGLTTPRALTLKERIAEKERREQPAPYGGPG